MRAFGKSDVGRVRNSNQDAFLCANLSENAVLAILCDGMGGASGGNVASSVTVDVVSTQIMATYRDDMSASSIKNMLESAVAAANIELFDRATVDEDLRGMGTTIVIALVVSGVLHLVHVGDSRAYLVDSEGLTQVTRDHTVVQTMVENGQITEEEARSHPRKHFITRAIGVDIEVKCEYNLLDMREKESLILCSDGLSNLLDEDDIFEMITQTENAEDVPSLLIHKANMAGGSDNITVIYMI